MHLSQHIGLPMFSRDKKPRRIHMMSLGVLNLPRLPVLDWAFGHSIVSCHVEHHLFPQLSDHMCLKVGEGRVRGAGMKRLLESRGWVPFSICLNTEPPQLAGKATQGTSRVWGSDRRHVGVLSAAWLNKAAGCL